MGTRLQGMSCERVAEILTLPDVDTCGGACAASPPDVSCPLESERLFFMMLAGQSKREAVCISCLSWSKSQVLPKVC